jgi:polar amino acid transport system substrate-binding protein
VRQQLEADAARVGGVRVLDGRFMTIHQAMGIPVARTGAVTYLRHFVEDMKAGGFVSRSLERHGIKGAVVAPAAAVTP